MDNWIKFFSDDTYLTSDEFNPRSWSKTRLDDMVGFAVHVTDDFTLSLYAGLGNYHYAVQCESDSVTGLTEVIGYFLQFELGPNQWLTQSYDKECNQVTTSIQDKKL